MKMTQDIKNPNPKRKTREDTDTNTRRNERITIRTRKMMTAKKSSKTGTTSKSTERIIIKSEEDIMTQRGMTRQGLVKITSETLSTMMNTNQEEPEEEVGADTNSDEDEEEADTEVIEKASPETEMITETSIQTTDKETTRGTTILVKEAGEVLIKHQDTPMILMSDHPEDTERTNMIDRVQGTIMIKIMVIQLEVDTEIHTMTDLLTNLIMNKITFIEADNNQNTESLEVLSEELVEISEVAREAEVNSEEEEK
jgi:hypothetical protein